jgi:pantoate--beta-alanine ligase
MSSRNAYLNAEERRAALVLYRALSRARERMQQGERDSANIAAEMRRLIEQEPSARTDYAAVVDAETLAPVERVAGRVLVALAVWIGCVRLIDNLLVDESGGRITFRF